MNAWFMRPKIDRSGRVHQWEYDPGVTLADYERMGWLTQEIPRVVDALDPAPPADPERTAYLNWFRDPRVDG
jgi:hypothetical protein